MYENWNFRCDLFASRSYVKAVSLYRALVAVRSASFSVKSSRQEARNKLLSLDCKLLFASDVRFPPGLYVDLSEGDAADIFATLTSSLDLSERYTDGHPEHLRRHDDSRVSFQQHCAQLLHMISFHPQGSAVQGLYTRDVIEEELDVTWTAHVGAQRPASPQREATRYTRLPSIPDAPDKPRTPIARPPGAT